jgi:hypothetical protein
MKKGCSEELLRCRVDVAQVRLPVIVPLGPLKPPGPLVIHNDRVAVSDDAPLVTRQHRPSGEGHADGDDDGRHDDPGIQR